jgi:hypothetical protein
LEWVGRGSEAMESITSYFTGKPQEPEGKVITCALRFVIFTICFNFL